MSETDGIAAFIAARLDEDEAAAWAAGDGSAGDYRWQELDPDRMPGLIGTGSGDVVTFNNGTAAYAASPSRGQAAHIARHDPARALREVAAKRRVLERHRPVGGKPSYRAQACAGCGTEGYCDDPVTAKMSDCPELRDVAAIWDDHPDYRKVWKP